MKRTSKSKRKIRANQIYFDDRKTAIAVANERGKNAYRVKYGRHRGRYFVGSYIEYINFC